MNVMTIVRLLADDLSGALDTASEFVAMAGIISVWWGATGAIPAASFAFDSETRDGSKSFAIERISALARMFEHADISYKKIDSLLRGNTAAELATCFAGGDFGSVIVCPAFPAQARITCGGRQYYRHAGASDWQRVATDLPAQLQSLGLAVRVVARGAPLHGGGVVFCDAETDDDLRAVAASSDNVNPPVLWCGSAGLAGALTKPFADLPFSHVRLPLLVIVGSDHPVSQVQVHVLAARRPSVIEILRSSSADDIRRAVRSTKALLAAGGVCAVALALPDGTPFERLECAMNGLFAELLQELPALASVFVSGGTTLHRLAETLGASELRMVGRLGAGVPVARFSNGAWSGTDVISKSGAFGPPQALTDLVEQIGDRLYVTA